MRASYALFHSVFVIFRHILAPLLEMTPRVYPVSRIFASCSTTRPKIAMFPATVVLDEFRIYLYTISTSKPMRRTEGYRATMCPELSRALGTPWCVTGHGCGSAPEEHIAITASLCRLTVASPAVAVRLPGVASFSVGVGGSWLYPLDVASRRVASRRPARTRQSFLPLFLPSFDLLNVLTVSALASRTRASERLR